MLNAENYRNFRVGYADEIIDDITFLNQYALEDTICLDVGAGTGLWTKQLAKKPFKEIIALEPNSEMFSIGSQLVVSKNIFWYKNNIKDVQFYNEKLHLISFATSLHLMNFTETLEKVNHILLPKGLFLAIWNPRQITSNSILGKIDEFMIKNFHSYQDNKMRKKNYGQSIYSNLLETKLFSEIYYLEKEHTVRLNRKQFVQQFFTTNTIKKKYGVDAKRKLLSYILEVLNAAAIVPVEYKTIAWVGVKR